MIKKIRLLFQYFFILYRRLSTRVNMKSILFVPHLNCENDNYDIINYKSDNVLCLFNSILKDSAFSEYELYIAYFDQNNFEVYQRYCEQYNLARIHFIYYYSLQDIYTSFYKCRYIFTDEIYRTYRFKSKKNKVICLNYYPFPYKSDYVKFFDKKKNKYSYLQEQTRINKSYDYLVSTSDLSSVAIIQAQPIYYEKCITLGFPRSDVFYTDNSSVRKKIVSLFPFDVKKIFVYVPTHRDYENIKSKAFDKTSTRRTIWGIESVENIYNLDKFLRDENAVIVAKIHPAQVKGILDDPKTDHIITYHDLASKMTVSLNELMAISDAMITDYTSAVFDYLMRDKPIVYYHFDIEKYDKTRGFFANPMKPFCVGVTCYNLGELTLALNRIVNGIDDFSIKRKFLLDLLVTYQDAKSAERIKDYFFDPNRS